jgi:hypothetical protein
MKVVLTGILGGIVMFIRMSIAHMSLPLGEASVREIPNESAVLNAMQSNIGDETGLYIFPGPGANNREPSLSSPQEWYPNAFGLDNLAAL